VLMREVPCPFLSMFLNGGTDDRYIGGATLIEDKSLLVSAAEILTVEARYEITG